jgi:hypothetical protein
MVDKATKQLYGEIRLMLMNQALAKGVERVQLLPTLCRPPPLVKMAQS